jgi:hypothetical protein
LGTAPVGGEMTTDWAADVTILAVGVLGAYFLLRRMMR